MKIHEPLEITITITMTIQIIKRDIIGKHMSLPNNHARFASLNTAFVQVATDYPKL